MKERLPELSKRHRSAGLQEEHRDRRVFGTLYPALLKLEQEGYISSEWGVSDNNRKAKYYHLTRAGRKRLEKEARQWERTTAIMARFLAPGEERP